MRRLLISSFLLVFSINGARHWSNSVGEDLVLSSVMLSLPEWPSGIAFPNIFFYIGLMTLKFWTYLSCSILLDYHHFYLSFDVILSEYPNFHSSVTDCKYLFLCCPLFCSRVQTRTMNSLNSVLTRMGLCIADFLKEPYHSSIFLLYLMHKRNQYIHCCIRGSLF